MSATYSVTDIFREPLNRIELLSSDYKTDIRAIELKRQIIQYITFE